MTMTPESPISSLEKPWLRLPPKMSKGGATESPRSFSKFERFRDLPASERPLALLAQLLGTTEESLEKLSTKHYWQERVAVWDRRQSDARVLEPAYVDAAVRRWQFTGSKRFVSGAAARSTRSPPEERLKVQRLCCASRIERPL
jgi:hypothetical protein